MLRNRAEGVVLTLAQGLTLKTDGDMAPLTGDSVSTPRYKLQQKRKSSPCMLMGPLGAMPPPLVTSHSILLPRTVKVPYAQVHARWSC